MVPKCVSAEVKIGVRWGEASKVIATMEDGVVRTIEFFHDEIMFSPSEVVGKTWDEVLALHMAKDRAYLQA